MFALISGLCLPQYLVYISGFSIPGPLTFSVKTPSTFRSPSLGRTHDLSYEDGVLSFWPRHLHVHDARRRTRLLVFSKSWRVCWRNRGRMLPEKPGEDAAVERKLMDSTNNLINRKDHPQFRMLSWHSTGSLFTARILRVTHQQYLPTYPSRLFSFPIAREDHIDSSMSSWTWLSLDTQMPLNTRDDALDRPNKELVPTSVWTDSAPTPPGQVPFPAPKFLPGVKDRVRTRTSLRRQKSRRSQRRSKCDS